MGDDEEEEEQIQGLLELGADAAALRYHADEKEEDGADGGTSSKSFYPSFSYLFGKMFSTISISSPGQHLSAPRAMRGWLRDR